MSDMSLHLKEGTLLSNGRYRIVRFISSGGFGCTYEAVHTIFDTKVAIKEFFVRDFCNRDENSQVSVATESKRDLVQKLLKKFVEEARVIYGMKHPHIVKVTDIFTDNGTAYYVMEYISGRSLNQVIDSKGLPEQQALRYIHQVSDALKYVHSSNRLHLDVKPGNIMIDDKDNAILIDFGASKHYDETSGENTSTLMGVNTPGYAPVEQASMGFSTFLPAADIYALGATLYKALTGITPPDAGYLVSGVARLQPLPSKVSENTRNAIEKAMQSRVADRPQTIDEFLAILDAGHESESTVIDNNKQEEISEDDPTIADDNPPKIPNPPTPKPQRLPGKKWMWMSLVIVLLIAVGFGVWSERNKLDDDSPINNELTWDSSAMTISCGNHTYKMVYIPGGTFTMGANPGDSEAYDREKPAHSVTLSSFYIGATEVPQWLWKAVMGNNPSYWKGDNLPVEQVSWNDCRNFISRLNSITGATFRLPTEAQWEYAARGGNYSNLYSGSNNIDDVAWYHGNSGSRTHEVGTKRANGYGLYDMSGNVWEWCWDYWQNPYPSSHQTNPTGPSMGSYRVYRGGSWFNTARFCRVSYRSINSPGRTYSNLGFRLAL